MGTDVELTGSTVLVTGGAGMIGSYTVDLLLREHSPAAVRILDCLSPSTHPEGVPAWIPPQCELIRADMRDREALTRALRGVDFVFHLAAFGQESAKSTCLAELVGGNCVGSATLFDVIKSEGLPIKKIVVASSMAVYGHSSYMRPDGSEYIPRDTRDPTRLAQGKYETVDEAGVECAGPYPVQVAGGESTPPPPPSPPPLGSAAAAALPPRCMRSPPPLH